MMRMVCRRFVNKKGPFRKKKKDPFRFTKVVYGKRYVMPIAAVSPSYTWLVV